jgi:guanylate kinase
MLSQGHKSEDDLVVQEEKKRASNEEDVVLERMRRQRDEEQAIKRKQYEATLSADRVGKCLKCLEAIYTLDDYTAMRCTGGCDKDDVRRHSCALIPASAAVS